MWCAYEGAIPADKTIGLMRQLREAASRRFYVAGSMGMEDPAQVGALFRASRANCPIASSATTCITCPAARTANVLAAVDAGASFIEGSICGIGGGIAMPTSVASVGNLPTEDLVCMFEAMGVRTGVAPEGGRRGGARHRRHAGHRGTQPRRQVGTRAELLEQGRQHPRNPHTASAVDCTDPFQGTRHENPSSLPSPPPPSFRTLAAPAFARGRAPSASASRCRRPGNLADSANHYWRGVELWRDHVNARGGLLARRWSSWSTTTAPTRPPRRACTSA
jgi:hypothetical protein